MNVLPDVQFGPVAQWKGANALALVHFAVVQVPELGPLIFRVPLMQLVAEAVDTFFGPAFLFVAAGPAEGRVELKVVQRLLQRGRFHDVGMFFRAMIERVDVLCTSLGVGPDFQVETVLATELIAEFDHRPELPGCIDVQKREGEPSGVERLLCQPQHHGRILADRVKHHGSLELRGNLADDVNTLRLKYF